METGLLLQVASSFTCTPIERSLSAAIAGVADGLGFVQYGQMSEYLLGQAAESPHILGTIILLRVEDWLRGNRNSAGSVLLSVNSQGELRQELGMRAQEFIEQLEVLAGRGKQVWFLACPSTGWLSDHHRVGVLCQVYSNLVAARVRALPNTTVLNWPASLSGSLCADHSADRLGQIPFTQYAFDQLGDFVGSQVARALARAQPARTAPTVGGSSELAAYLAGLDLEVELAPATPGHRAHVDRLLRTAATFSLTGEDPDIAEAEIDRSVESGSCQLVSVSDRVSDNGISGLVVFREAENSIVVGRLALSCTVLGKQVEYAVLSALARIATERHLATVIFEYRESGRNQEMRRFLQSIADRESGGGYVVPTSLVEDRIRAAATSAGAWNVRLQDSRASCLETEA